MKREFLKANNQDFQFESEEEFLDKLKLFNLVEKYKIFISEFQTTEDYHRLRIEITDKIIEMLEENEAYKNFNEAEIKEITYTQLKTSKDVYKRDNLNKKLISIDLKKANFEVLKEYDKNIINNKENYEEFMKEFTNSETIINSKKIRQYIFGNLNPKRTAKLMRNKINNLAICLVDKIKIDPEKILCLNKDELVLEGTEEQLKSIKEFLKDENFKIEFFELIYYEVGDFYEKRFFNGKESVLKKCTKQLKVPAQRVIVKKEPLKDSDLLVEFNDLKGIKLRIDQKYFKVKEWLK